MKAYAFLAPTDPDYEPVDRLLRRYHDRAPEKFEVLFKDPRKSPDLAQKYELREGQTTIVLARGSGDKESHTAVSVLNGVTEQDLTNALIKLNAVGEQKVYFTTGHGEWPLEPSDAPRPGVAQRAAQDRSSRKATPRDSLNLADAKDVPRDAALVVIAGAKSKFSKGEAEQLGRYLDQGGRLLYFAEAAVEPGLDALLARAGVQVDKGVLADDVYAIDSPYLVVSHFFGDTELARDLKKAQYNLQFPTARGLTVLHEGLAEGTQVSPVLLTSPNAFEVTHPGGEPPASERGQGGQHSPHRPVGPDHLRAGGQAQRRDASGGVRRLGDPGRPQLGRRAEPQHGDERLRLGDQPGTEDHHPPARPRHLHRRPRRAEAARGSASWPPTSSPSPCSGWVWRSGSTAGTSEMSARSRSLWTLLVAALGAAALGLYAWFGVMKGDEREAEAQAQTPSGWCSPPPSPTAARRPFATTTSR